MPIRIRFRPFSRSSATSRSAGVSFQASNCSWMASESCRIGAVARAAHASRSADRRSRSRWEASNEVRAWLKAVAVVHPDKNQGSDVEQQLLAERIFNVLRDSFDAFKSELGQ